MKRQTYKVTVYKNNEPIRIVTKNSWNTAKRKVIPLLKSIVNDNMERIENINKKDDKGLYFIDGWEKWITEENIIYNVRIQKQ